MKQVLMHIHARNEVFARCRMFEYLRSPDTTAEQRLSFAPCMAHFVFSFMDVNRFVLRDETDPHPHQELVNIHTEEDAHHWPWYINDLAAMGLDKQMRFSEALRFVWSDATVASRMLTYKFCAIALNATPTERLAVVETVETTGNTFLHLAAQISAQVKDASAGQHVYYGPHHAGCETGHHMGTPGVADYLDAIELTPAERERCYDIVDRIYALYTAFTEEAHRFVTTHALEDLRRDRTYCEQLEAPGLPPAPGSQPGGRSDGPVLARS